MVKPGCTPTTPALRNGLTWRRHLAILFLGVVAVFMVACSSVVSEPVGAVSTPDNGVAASDDDPASSPNTAVLDGMLLHHPVFVVTAFITALNRLSISMNLGKSSMWVMLQPIRSKDSPVEGATISP